MIPVDGVVMIALINITKEKFYSVYKWLKYPEKAVCRFCEYQNYRYAHLIPDRIFLKCFFSYHMKTKLNLSHPITFSEKLQWLKLHDRRPEYIAMADKAQVKQLVADRIGKEHIIPTIGVYDSVEDIPFEQLPDRFVIKCTHDSGSAFVCTEKKSFDVEAVKQKLAKRLKTNFFWYGREWPYKNIRPRIIVEEFIGTDAGVCPLDYKFFCFNGKMEYFKIDYNRFTKRAANYYDNALKFQPFGKINSMPDPSIPLELPENYREMVRIAEKLSQGIPFVRVDLYSAKDTVFFGELTFYPSSGVEPFTENGDLILGEHLILSKKRGRK